MVAYFSGDAGRILIASGAGGLTRWLVSHPRRIVDGIVAVIVGVLVGRYLWPLGLSTLGLDETPNNIAMAAFVTGTLGMSVLRIVAAQVEARAAKFGGGDGRP